MAGDSHSDHGKTGHDHRNADAPRPTSTRVVDAVASATNTDPVELAPLYETIDTDALDALFPQDGSGNCHLYFEFGAVDVYVSIGGHVTVVDESG